MLAGYSNRALIMLYNLVFPHSAISYVFHKNGSVRSLHCNGKWKSVCTDSYLHADKLYFHDTYKNKDH